MILKNSFTELMVLCKELEGLAKVTRIKPKLKLNHNSFLSLFKKLRDFFPVNAT